MTLTDTDFDQIHELISEGIEELILPKFDHVNARLDGLSGRLDKMEAHLADIRTNQVELIDVLQGKGIVDKKRGASLRERIFGRAA
ncbi:hypothetical protein HY411_00590 [Candidatus Gottesmanbacteria bacterium]|nr:hypothetical protein [Candidatus Gottesmanbacteria bacterium]